MVSFLGCQDWLPSPSCALSHWRVMISLAWCRRISDTCAYSLLTTKVKSIWRSICTSSCCWLPSLFDCNYVQSSLCNCHDSWGRGLDYTTPWWAPIMFLSQLRLSTTLCIKGSLSLLSLYFACMLWSQRGYPQKALQCSRVRLRAINMNHKCAFNEQLSLPGGPTPFIPSLLGLCVLIIV